MELSWPMRLRIAAAMGFGAVLLGFGAWPLIRPTEALGAVTLVSSASSITPLDTIACVALAFIAGLVAFFLAYPHGCHIAPLAAPAGLAVWAFRSGGASSLLLVNNTLSQRQAVYAVLKWEGFFWLLIVAAGYFGVLTAQKLFKIKSGFHYPATNHNSRFSKALNIIIAIVATVAIGQFAIGIFAQDVRLFDSRLTTVLGQPGTGQIAFAVLVSFAIAAFVVRYYLQVDYQVVVLSAPLLILFSITTYGRAELLGYMAENWPAVFFVHATMAILPVQLIAFAAIGSVAGYWLAIKYAYWRKHGS